MQHDMTLRQFMRDFSQKQKYTRGAGRVKHLKHTLNSLARYLFIDRGTGALGHGAPLF